MEIEDALCGVWTREEGRGETGPSLGGPDGCGCVPELPDRPVWPGRAGRRGWGEKKIRGQWAGEAGLLEQMPGEQWGF